MELHVLTGIVTLCWKISFIESQTTVFGQRHQHSAAKGTVVKIAHQNYEETLPNISTVSHTALSADRWSPSLSDIQIIYDRMPCNFQCKTSICDIDYLFPQSVPTVCSCLSNCLNIGDCCVNYEEVCIFNSSGMEAGSPSNTVEHDISARRRGWIFQNQFSSSTEGTRVTNIDKNEISNSFHMPESYEYFAYKFQKKFVSCVYLHHEDTKPFEMVTKCPIDLPIDIVYEEIALCEDTPTQDSTLYQHVPILVGVNIYRNIYCLYCHFGKNSTSNFTVVGMNPSFTCSTDNEIKALDLLKSNGSVATERFLLHNCDLLVSKDIYNHVGTKKCFQGIIDTCREDLKESIPNYEALKLACSTYASYVSISPSGLRFKNLHCAICNGLSQNDINNATCFSPLHSRDPIKYPTRYPSFTILMDFLKESKVVLNITNLCNLEREVLDVVSNECIRMPCPRNQIRFNDICVYSNDTLFQPQVVSLNHSLFITLVFTSTPQGYGPEYFIQIFNFGFLHWSNFDFAFDPFFLVSFLHPCNQVESLGNRTGSTQGEVCITVQAQSGFIGTRNTMLFFSSPRSEHFLKDIHEILPFIEMTVMSSDDSMVCNEASYFATEQNVRLVTEWNTPLHLERFDNNISFRRIEEDLKIYLVPYALPIDFTYANTEVKISPYNSGKPNVSLSWRKTMGSSVCKPLLKLCQQANDTIFHSQNISDKGSDSPGKEFCVEAASSPLETMITIDGLLSVIGISFSLAGLSCTLFVHCLVPSLLTIPGKAIMNLSISLILAQSFFLFNPWFAGKGMWCLSVASLQHYLWLVSFAWMNVIAYDLWKAFASAEESHTYKRPANILRRYSLYGWGVPGIIIALFLLFEKTIHIKYVDYSTCWISPGLILGLSFALPIGILLFVNAICFAKAVVAINSNMRISQTAGIKYSNYNKLALFVKLISLMGFTWIFGFLCNIEILSFLKYVFIVSCAASGVFICFAFSLNRRARTLLKIRLTSCICIKVLTDKDTIHTNDIQ